MAVSILVGSVGRTPYLVKALASWLPHPEVAEIVVVDWNSAPPLADELSHIADQRLRIVRVVGVERWAAALALNFGLTHVRHPLLLKLDADTVLRPGFFAQHPLQADAAWYYTGNWARGRDENERHLNGVLYAATERVRAVGGYNEWLRTYGWEDTDLYDRVTASGVERRDLAPAYLAHLPHGDHLRSAVRDIKFLILRNMHLARRLPWGPACPRAAYMRMDEEPAAGDAGAKDAATLIKAADTTSPVSVAGGTTSATSGATGVTSGILVGTWHPLDLASTEPPGPVVAECEQQARRSILAETGYGWELTAGRAPETLLRLYFRRARPRVLLEARNGLGNRLRALASAAVIAEALERPLVLVWIPDLHCGAPFEELFEAGGLLHTPARPVLKSPPLPPISTNADAPDALDTAGELYVASACVLKHPATNWLKEAEWLQRHIRPTPRVADRIAREARRISPAAAASRADWRALALSDVVGLHIRMGQDPAAYKYEDTASWSEGQRRTLQRSRAQSHWAHFLWEAERVWRRTPGQRFLLCADGPEAYAAFAARHPARVDTTLFWVPKAEWDRSRGQLEGALVDVYLLAKCREVWGSPWSSYTELVSRLRAPAPPPRLAGTHFGRHLFGRLFYPGTRNIGDDIQAYAAARFLPHVDYLVDRDDQAGQLYHPDGTPAGPPGSARWPVVVVENGWFDGRLLRWPPAPGLLPVFISFHLNEGPALFDDPRYDILRPTARMDATLLSAEGAAYFRRHGPVGARDQRTLDRMRAAGIPAYHSCCLTLTLDDMPPLPRGDEVLLVDADIDDWPLLEQLVPRAIIDHAARVRHGTTELRPWAEKLRLVDELLERYRRARCVITSRLHCALPCLAFGTPVVWLFRRMDADPRFDATLYALLGDGVSLPEGWDWEKPAVAPAKKELVARLAQELRARLREQLFAVTANS
jgi:hypothetical protein